MLRHSSLFQFRHGDHTCVFYRTEDALREILTPFVADGLRRGERCFCAEKSHIARRLVFDLRFLGIDTDEALRRGALEIHTEDDVYLPNNKFEPQFMMNMLLRSMDDALHKGFAAFRSAGELSWAVRGIDRCDQLIDYEKIVDECFPGKPAIGLCQYDINAFAPEVLEAAIQAHRMRLADVSHNPTHSGMAIRHGEYWSEIVVNRHVPNPSYYYVVEHHRPTEVVGWGIAKSFDIATEQAGNLVQKASDHQRAVSLDSGHQNAFSVTKTSFP